MPKTRLYRPALTLLVAILAGCQTPAQAPLLSEPQVAVTTTEVAMRVPRDMGALQLAISFKTPDSATYRVLTAGDLASWFQDIDRITFTIEGEKLKAPITSVVTRSQFLNNKAVLQVNNLPLGPITVKAVALRADGSTIVESHGDGTVVANEVIGINMVCEPMPTPEGGHVRIQMDCWTTCGCGNTPEDPAPTPTAFVPVPLDIVKFQSTGDPHEEGGNGYKFDNYMAGTFLALRTLTGDFTLEKHHDLVPNGLWAGKTVNNAVAVKTGDDIFLYYAYGQRAFFNGRKVTIKDGDTLSGPNGMQVTRKGTQYQVKTGTGDAINVFDRTTHLDITGTVSGDRVVHEVSGSLGTYNNETTTNAMRKRNGQVAADLKTFLTDWLVKPAEDLFPTSEAFIPTGFVIPGSSPAPTPTPTATPSVAPSPSPSPAGAK